MPESWRKAWRVGFAPQLGAAELAALRDALAADDPALIQQETVCPAEYRPDVSPAKCESRAACAVGYAGWRGRGLLTVGEIEDYFGRVCYEADQLLGEPAGCRFFLNWFDETPRDEMRRQLLYEVMLALRERSETCQTS